MRVELVNYIEHNIIPLYDSFDGAHNRIHVKAVISSCLKMAESYTESGTYSGTGTVNGWHPFTEMDRCILYTAAAYHDTGLTEGRKQHHLVSGRIIRSDVNLKKWFTIEQIEIIAQAAEDHRASAGQPPRSIYGRIIAEADRHINTEDVIKRCVRYEIAHNPDVSKVICIDNVIKHLHEKYGRNGYIKLWIPGSENEKELERLRCLLDSSEKTLKTVSTIYDEISDNSQAEKRQEVRV